MFILQFILFIIFLIKKAEPLKYFLLSFKTNHHNVVKTNKKNNNKKERKSIKKIKVNPPKKNNKSSKFLLNEDFVERKKSSKNFSKIKINNKIINQDDIFNNFGEQNMENKQNNFNLLRAFESKMKLKNNVFISHNFAPTINIQIPNYNNFNEIQKEVTLIKDNKIRNVNSKS